MSINWTELCTKPFPFDSFQPNSQSHQWKHFLSQLAPNTKREVVLAHCFCFLYWNAIAERVWRQIFLSTKNALNISPQKFSKVQYLNIMLFLPLSFPKPMCTYNLPWELLLQFRFQSWLDISAARTVNIVHGFYILSVFVSWIFWSSRKDGNETKLPPLWFLWHHSENALEPNGAPKSSPPISQSPCSTPLDFLRSWLVAERGPDHQLTGNKADSHSPPNRSACIQDSFSSLHLNSTRTIVEC